MSKMGLHLDFSSVYVCSLASSPQNEFLERLEIGMLGCPDATKTVYLTRFCVCVCVYMPQIS